MSATVRTLSQDELEHYRQALKTRKRAISDDLRARHKRAWDIAHQAADLMKTEYGATKVVAFGSLAEIDLFHARSDIDLAVWDLSAGDYFRAVGVLQSLSPAFSIDLVDFDDASAALQEVIIRQGIEI